MKYANITTAFTYVKIIAALDDLLKESSINIGSMAEIKLTLNEPWELEAIRAALLTIKQTYGKALEDLGVSNVPE